MLHPHHNRAAIVEHAPPPRGPVTSLRPRESAGPRSFRHPARTPRCTRGRSPSAVNQASATRSPAAANDGPFTGHALIVHVSGCAKRRPVPGPVLEPQHGDVANLAVRSIAVGDERTAGRGHRGRRAALAHARIDPLVTVQCCRPARCGRCAGSSTRRRGRRAPRRSILSSPVHRATRRRRRRRACGRTRQTRVRCACRPCAARHPATSSFPARPTPRGARHRRTCPGPLYCSQCATRRPFASGNTEGTSAQFTKNRSRSTIVIGGDQARPSRTA